MNAVAGENVLQSCLSRKGKPPPRLGWALSYDAECRNISAWLGETRVKFSHLFKNTIATQESLQAEIEEEIQKDGHGYIVSSNIRPFSLRLWLTTDGCSHSNSNLNVAPISPLLLPLA
ncbi:unnamed protein product [Cylicostephanus goldi]|uniref:Uncharacterized protein n=1 Tax=Cylicostephanus goldi TaxID=71465 RepID=A0A3P6RTU6_CYLGO|nr:unnamed protein product [Cylicostephanus goldi]